MKLAPIVLTLALAACAAEAPLAPGGPNPQLALSVSDRLDAYGIEVAPEDLNRQQASALHTLLVSERGWLNVRRKARAILGATQFR